jgi:hypothetical protein
VSIGCNKKANITTEARRHGVYTEKMFWETNQPKKPIQNLRALRKAGEYKKIQILHSFNESGC